MSVVYIQAAFDSAGAVVMLLCLPESKAQPAQEKD